MGWDTLNPFATHRDVTDLIGAWEPRLTPEVRSVIADALLDEFALIRKDRLPDVRSQFGNITPDAPPGLTRRLDHAWATVAAHTALALHLGRHVRTVPHQSQGKAHTSGKDGTVTEMVVKRPAA